jgi:hypothetical protein
MIYKQIYARSKLLKIPLNTGGSEASNINQLKPNFLFSSLIISILHSSGGRSSVIPSDSIIIISAPENSGDFYKIVKQISGNSSNNTISEDKYLPGRNINP